MAEQSRIILFVQGGAGDVIAHTPMIRGFRRKYPDDKIIVLSTYSQLLEENPNIDELIPLRDPKDFYSEHVLGKNVRFFKKHFVYDAIMDEPAAGSTCLPEFICNLYGIDYDGKPLDYFVTDYENRCADVFMAQYRNHPEIKNKKIVLLHCTGSIPSDGNFNKTNNLKDLNIQTVNQLVKNLSDKVLFIHMGLEGEPKVEGAIDAHGMPMREAIALIPRCDSFIFIESIFAHCSNALGKSGLVVFQNTSPDFFGYSNNSNISYSGGCKLWPCNRPVGALLDLNPGYRNPKTREKILWECPDQVCARMPLSDLTASLEESLGWKNQDTQNEVKGLYRNASYAQALATPAPQNPNGLKSNTVTPQGHSEKAKISGPTTSSSEGCVGAGNLNTPELAHLE